LTSTIYQLVKSHAEKSPNAVAIAAPGRLFLTYGKLLSQIDRVVTSIHAIGVGRNDRVALVLPNKPELAVAFLAIASSAACAPLNPAYRESEFDFYLSDLNARCLVIESGADSPAIAVAQRRGIPIVTLSPLLAAEAGIFTVEGAAASCAARGELAGADDVALVLHTSGTTARPKRVPLTHRNLLTSAGNVAAALSLNHGDRCLNVMPLYHIHGLVGAVLASLAAGASVAVTPDFDSDGFFDWLEELQPTWYTAVPTLHQGVLRAAKTRSPASRRWPLRFVRSSSAALPLKVKAELEELFNVPVIEAYGMTEASHQIASNPLPPRPRKAGVPFRMPAVER
jgi:acyl-CoA synthetase (AMP-forming)/AMP-acid ligase II